MIFDLNTIYSNEINEVIRMIQYKCYGIRNNFLYCYLKHIVNVFYAHIYEHYNKLTKTLFALKNNFISIHRKNKI